MRFVGMATETTGLKEQNEERRKLRAVRTKWLLDLWRQMEAGEGGGWEFPPPVLPAALNSVVFEGGPVLSG